MNNENPIFMKNLTFILSFASLIAFSQNKQSNHIISDKLPQKIIYVSNPNPNDSLCISEIKRAKKDVANGKIVFTQKTGILFGNIRYKRELQELCKLNGLLFANDLIGCVRSEGQTQGCYGDYMDKIIIEKYGLEFKKNLHKKADSLFLVRTNLENKSVAYFYCDERPRLPNEIKRTSDELANIDVPDLDIKASNGDYYRGWPFMDLSFIVEKDSTIAEFNISNFVSQLEENKKFKEDLYKIAIDYLKNNYPIWVPGKIKGIPVRTYNNVRIFFIKSKQYKPGRLFPPMHVACNQTKLLEA